MISIGLGQVLPTFAAEVTASPGLMFARAQLSPIPGRHLEVS